MLPVVAVPSTPRGWVGGHIEVQNTTPVMSQHQKHVKDLETDRGHRKEVDRNELLGVILQKCAPGLRGRLAAPHHIFAHAALPDVDAEFEQFAVDSGCTPIGILRQILRIRSRSMLSSTDFSLCSLKVCALFTASQIFR